MERLKSWAVMAALVAATTAMLYDLSRAPRSTYTRQNYERLQLGMTRDDVVAIMGEPDGKDESMERMEWAVWLNPFDAQGSITAIFVYPSEELATLEYHGELPSRPLLIPDDLPARRVPLEFLNLDLYNQMVERRAMLMLDPQRRGPVVPPA